MNNIIFFKAYMMFICIFLCFVAINTLKMSVKLQPEQKKCFYQKLSLRQKYAVEISSANKGDFQLDIKHLNNNNQWAHSVNRINQENSSTITIHKLASHQTTYSICIINHSFQNLQLKINIKWGLQLLDLNVLVQEDDQKVVDEFVKWIDEECDKLIEIGNTVSSRRTLKQQLKNILALKFMVFAILGILMLIFINIFFYSSIKKTLKSRKMI